MRFLQVKPPILLLALGLLVPLTTATPWLSDDDEYYDYEYYEYENGDETALEELESANVELVAQAVSELEATVGLQDEGQTKPEDSETHMTEVGDEEGGETTLEPSTDMETEAPTRAEPVHPEKASRGAIREHLTLHDGTGATTLTFLGHNAAARVDDEALTDFAVNKVIEFEFSFRTDSPHGLIAFLRQLSVPAELEGTRIQLYIYLKRGHLGVTHAFGNNTEHFLMKRGGLQQGNWHSAIVKVNAITGQLVMVVNQASQEEFTIASLRDSPSYNSGHSHEEFASRLWVGGMFKEALEREDVVAGFVHFHGCLKDLSIMSGETSEDMVGVRGFRTSRHHKVKEKCSDNCADRYKNICSPSSRCVEHFDHLTCDCFNSNQDGERCENPVVPVLTLSSDGYVVHRLYEWMDRVHSYNTRISLEFKTSFGNSILFYASAEHPEKQYLGASITNGGHIYVEANFGGGAISMTIREKVTKEMWHKLTVIHHQEKIQVYLDSKLKGSVSVPGEVRYLHLNPDFYVGNAPSLNRFCGLAVDGGTHSGPLCQLEHQQRYHYNIRTGTCLPFNYTGCDGNQNRFTDHATCMDTCHIPGLRSLNTFLGCLRNVFYNDVSIIQQLKENKKNTRYYGMTNNVPVSTTCTKRDMVLVTLSTEKARIHLNNANPDNFHIIVSFKPTKPRGVVASGFVDLFDTMSKWEIRHDDKLVHFYVHDNLINIKPNAKIKIGHWQYVDLRYKNGRITMRVNQLTVTKKPPGDLTFSSEVIIGGNLLEEYAGFVGCLRRLELGGREVDLRSVVGTPLAHRDVTFDGCQVLGPCERPGSCEHGATCTVVEDGVSCDCTGTGYTGKKCHFSLYKKSCELYRQIGYNTSGIYRIDVDGNGPLPPSFVKCDFSDFTGETTTIVEHNLPSLYEVRKPNLGDLEVNVDYRDFSSEMLKSLISQSKHCTQEVKYDCRRSPISLFKRTWFSSPSKRKIASFGTDTPGLCRCKEINACEKLDVACNCDIGDGLPRWDQGFFQDSRHLPITGMVFLKDRAGEKEDSEAFMTLGSLMCTNEATEKHTVSFTKSGSYLEVPAWREGSLFLSFKTTSSKAIVAYQPAYHPDHATFKLSLLGKRELEFTYHFHGHFHHHIMTTRHPLNTGRWQQVLIEFYDHQLRLSVNFEEKLIDIDKDANLGVLDGSMFLGAIPPQFLTEEDKEEGLEGLVGCIRGLTLNDEVVDLKPFIRVSGHGVNTGCTPSCDPNPCKNGAKCIEKWGTYECVCKNPLAHSGENCEKNINENAITFTTEESKYMYFVNDTVGLGEYNLVKHGFLLNFRTHLSTGLILFVHDYLHNFVQLYLAKKNEVVFMFNHYKEVKKMVVRTDGDEALNTGESVQVMVQRSPTTTSVFVYTSKVFFSHLDVGVRLLEEVDYEQFPFGESRPLPEMVYYPHSVTMPSPFLQAYLGSADDLQHDVQSAIPGFVGCVRGFKIGSKLVSLTDLVSRSTYPVEDIKLECSMACDMRPCRNGGTCMEDFHFYNNFQCDCSDTSYTGATCSSETAYTFFGRQWISQDAATSPIGTDFRFELAFSTSGTHTRPQLLALLKSTDIEIAHDYLLLLVEPDGSLVVAAQLSDLDAELVVGARVTPSVDDFQAFDGYRHSVVVVKTADGLMVKVDKQEEEVFPLWNVSRMGPGVKTTPTGLYIGGLEEGVDERFVEYDNFHGCISNVRLRTPAGESVPLQQYSDNDRHMRKSGMPGYGSCAGFAATDAPGILLTYGDNLNMSAVMGAEWAFMTAQRQPYHTVYIETSHPQRDTRMDDVVPTVSGIILIVSAVLVVFLLVRSHFKRKKRAAMKEEEEMQPLFNGGQPGLDPRTQIFVVSEKEPMLPVTSVRDGFSPDVKLEPDATLDAKLDEVPLTEAPPASAEEPELTTTDQEDPQEAVQVRKTKDSEEGTDVGERPLSWDKALDNLPLIIGSQDEQVVRQPTGDSSSDSSIDCTINITGTPPSGPTSPEALERPSVDEVSISSTKVQRGSNSMIYMDEETPNEEGSDSEPQILKYAPLPSEYVEGQQTEEENVQSLEVEPREADMDGDMHPQVGEGEVQKIVNDEEENMYVVVDDEQEENEVKESEDTREEEKEEDNEDDTEVEADVRSSLEDRAVPETQVDDGHSDIRTDDKHESEDSYPEFRADNPLQIIEDGELEIKDQPEAREEPIHLEIREDQPELETVDQSDVKDDNQLEAVVDQPESKEEDDPQLRLQSEMEVKTDNELQVDTTPDSTTEADEEEVKVDADDTPKEEAYPESQDDTSSGPPELPDFSEKVAEAKDTKPETSAESAPTAETGDSVPADDAVDDDFIEMRPEHEDILDARRMTTKVTSYQPVKSPTLANPQGAKHLSLQPQATEEADPEHRIDIQKYYLTKKVSDPPALPPKEKHYT